ncbi:MAG TPA: hypothetical protein VIW28_09630 [Gemmatimonadales bacterium]|jgi:hypothetical protein
MSKRLLQLAAVGLVGVVCWKIFFPFVLPFFWLMVKAAFVVGLVLLVMWWLRKDDRKRGEAPPSPPPAA